MILSKGRPCDSILAQQSLETQVLLGQGLISPAKRGVVGGLGLLIFVVAFPRENLMRLAFDFG